MRGVPVVITAEGEVRVPLTDQGPRRSGAPSLRAAEEMTRADGSLITTSIPSRAFDEAESMSAT